MTRDTKLADEILTLASATSLDYQEHVLDVVKAMNFTRNVVQREFESHEHFSEMIKPCVREPGTNK